MTVFEKASEEFKKYLGSRGHQVELYKIEGYVPHYWCKNCKKVYYLGSNLCHAHRSIEYSSAQEFIQKFKLDRMWWDITWGGNTPKCIDAIIEGIIR